MPQGHETGDNDRNFTWTQIYAGMPGQGNPGSGVSIGLRPLPGLLPQGAVRLLLIDDAVFLMNLYSSDDDTYDTQCRSIAKA